MADVNVVQTDEFFKFIVVGGGIAGVTCAETLSSLCSPDKVLLLTASPLIKAVTNFRKLTKTLEEFDVEEKPMFELGQSFPNIIVKHQKVCAVKASTKEISTENNMVYKYEKLCLCTGGSPKVIAKDNPYVLGIRDTETVKVFQEKLQNAKRIVVIGNGGIATELVHEIEACEVIWAIKDKSITSAFIDAGAAKFCLPSLCQDKPKNTAKKRTKYKIQDDVATTVPTTPQADTLGGALGPDWHEGVDLRGSHQKFHKVHVEYSVEVTDLLNHEHLCSQKLTPEDVPEFNENKTGQENWPVYVKLTNNKIFGCDFIVSATGVVPNTLPFVKSEFSISEEDGGINVNQQMQTSVDSIYAAGDVCHADWEHSTYWIQMRLWSQARQMGAYAAQCMVENSKGEEMTLDFCFEMFAHVTTFFNYKVVLLGKFNAQGIEEKHELLLRMTKGHEYVKVVLKDGKMHGALLIGKTDLEETFENLILNQMDLSEFGEDLLNPNIDIEDFFD